MDPMQLWQQWYSAWLRTAQAAAAGGAAPSGAAPGAAFTDPWGLAAQWLAATGAGRPAATPGASSGAGPNPLDPAALWQWWLSTLLAAMSAAMPGVMSGMAPGAAPGERPAFADPIALLARWQELLRAGADTGAGAGTADVAGAGTSPPPLAAWTAFRRWYDAISEPWARAMDELVGSTAFAEAAGKLLDGYASSVRALRRNSEQIAGALQLPTRSDLARVASLVVALEEKVDRIEQAQEAATDHAADAVAAQAATATATARALGALESRLDRLEAKLDRLLAASEREETWGSEHSRSGSGSGAQDAERATGNSHAPTSTAGTARPHKPTTTTRAARGRRGTPGTRTPQAS